MLPPPSFKSKNLIFRAVDAEKDKAFIHEVLSQPSIMFNSSVGLPNPSTMAATEDRINHMTKIAALTLLACIPQDGTTPETPVGWANVMNVGGDRLVHHRAYDFAINMHSDYRGRGYGFELLYALFDHAFRYMSAHRIQGAVFAWNESARKLYQKLGIVEEGVKKAMWWQDGAWRDEIILRLLDTDWDEFKSKRTLEQ